MSTMAGNSVSEDTLANTAPADSQPSSIKNENTSEDFKLGTRGALVFFTLAILTLMAALDGTSISVALPVSIAPWVC